MQIEKLDWVIHESYYVSSDHLTGRRRALAVFELEKLSNCPITTVFRYRTCRNFLLKTSESCSRNTVLHKLKNFNNSTNNKNSRNYSLLPPKKIYTSLEMALFYSLSDSKKAGKIYLLQSIKWIMEKWLS